ncbi:MAG: hypothetical protein V1905_03085 [bacterium]
MNYYIKTIWGPWADRYPEKDKGGVISFNEKFPWQAKRFKECDGFFLYETGREENDRIGFKTIYAYGQIADNQKGEDLEITHTDTGKVWGCRVRVNIKRVRSKDGIPISRLRKLGIKQFQAQGGLIRITDKQFVTLKKELDKIQNK